MKKQLSIKVHHTNNFTDEQLKKYIEAVRLTEIVLNSERFKKKLLELKFTSNKGMSNQEIYDLMMTGAETLEPVEDNEADVFITMYYKGNSVVGYTYPSTRETWVNSKFFNMYNHAEIGCNLVHEWFHKLGFDHRSASEHTSVPYAIGYLVEDCIEELVQHPELYNDSTLNDENLPEITVKKVKVCKRLWYTLWIKKVCWYKEVWK